jgi:hypothetical protein
VAARTTEPGGTPVSRDASLPVGVIDLAADVQEFFREAVDGAVRSRGFDPTPAAEVYVAALLADFARPDPAAPGFDRPLTLVLQEALLAAGAERFERLRTLGDGVLYVTGFFGDHLSNRGVPVDYVQHLGSSAYDHAAAMLRGGGDAANVLAELATRFSMFVELVNDVADRLLARSARSDRDLVRVYERWLRTGSTELAAMLVGRGITPVRGDGSLN